jgi:putative addiction module killer protein
MRSFKKLKVLKNHEIKEYITDKGLSPFRRWLDSLKDIRVKARIQARILRLEFGNLRDHRFVGQGVHELRLDFGPGYRVYFGLDDNTLVLLLLGGDKSSQQGDIQKARKFWMDYLEEKLYEKK